MSDKPKSGGGVKTCLLCGCGQGDDDILRVTVGEDVGETKRRRDVRVCFGCMMDVTNAHDDRLCRGKLRAPDDIDHTLGSEWEALRVVYAWLNRRDHDKVAKRWIEKHGLLGVVRALAGRPLEAQLKDL